MGLFSVTPRRKSSTAEQAADARPPVKSRLSIRSVLSRKESCERVARRQAAAPKGSKASAGLTVSVEATRQDSRHPIVYTAPCRYVATSTKLGSGAYGAVLLGRDMCFGNAPVAIKFIPDGRMRTSSLDREVAMLQRLSDAKHPSLVKFYGHVHPENVKAGEVRAEGRDLPLPKPHTTCHALVMEAVRGGELFDHVVKREGLNEREAAPLYAQMCDAVHAAHGLGITHRDLKLENVLLVRKANAPAPKGSEEAGPDGRPPSSIKLIDWGLAHQHAIGSDGTALPEKLHSRCGSRSYMAPEVTNRDISATVGYDGFAADVWSLGVCLFAMHLAFFPFEQANPENDWRARRVIEAQRNGKSTMATILSFYPQKAPNGGLSEPLLQLLDRMLIFNPRRRATLTEVLCSEWLAPHVPAACARFTLAHTLSITRLATRSGRSVSSGTSEGPLTPRNVIERGIEEPCTPSSYASTSGRHSIISSREASEHQLRQSRLIERVDSSGTSHSRASSIASHAGHVINSHVMPFPSTGPRHERRPSGGISKVELMPPPPSPLYDVADEADVPDHIQVVVAGGREGPHQLTKDVVKHGRHSSEKDPKEASDADLSSLMAKACKVTNLGSPRHPDRGSLITYT